jgi:hypothetical protein
MPCLLLLQLRLLEAAADVDVSDVTEALQATFQAAYAAAYVVGWDCNHLLHCRVDGSLLGECTAASVCQRLYQYGRVETLF